MSGFKLPCFIHRNPDRPSIIARARALKASTAKILHLPGKTRSAGTLSAAAHRAQARALEIESQAKLKLADEYDAAQERGEIQRPGGDRISIIPDENNAARLSEAGLSAKQMHEARQFRDAEKAEPGIIKRTISDRLERGEAPTKA